jgi:hypothetical protein
MVMTQGELWWLGSTLAEMHGSQLALILPIFTLARGNLALPYIAVDSRLLDGRFRRHPASA